MPSPSDAAELKALHDLVDGTRREVELIWGAERLPYLVGMVDPEWLRRLHSQKTRFSTALQAAWDADHVTGEQMQAVRDSAAGMQRAWPKLAEVVTEAGHRPLRPDVLFERILPDGTLLVVVRDNDSAASLIADGRAAAVYTADEVAHLIGTFVPESLNLAKVHFPGAKFQGASLPDGPAWRAEGDELPDFTQGQAA